MASSWHVTDTLEQRLGEIGEALDLLLDGRSMPVWNSLVAAVPIHIMLKELSDYIGTEKEELQQQLLLGVKNRLKLEGEEASELTPKINILSMHGAKGLSAQVVFVPGLEEDLIPSPKSQAYTGLVQEEARLLYVSITRARALCALSYSQHRVVNGSMAPMRASRFVPHLGGAFVPRAVGLTDTEATAVIQTVAR